MLLMLMQPINELCLRKLTAWASPPSHHPINVQVEYDVIEYIEMCSQFYGFLTTKKEKPKEIPLGKI